ncbi:unnamed protein product [Polarella glacialis]|uniref:Uncharacterized protein n=1 Tax=Polarella glacialis TaxID=89957 RepID=A0A813FJ34_POLGL|nr:unnamed protein product [Polarella glacialis]
MKQTASSAGIESAYDAFRAKHGRTQSVGSARYSQRVALFTKSHADVEAQNSLPGALWNAEINKFADQSDEEFKGLLGYRRLGQWWEASGAASGKPPSFLQLHNRRMVASTVDWRSNLTSSKFLREQGACGSSWAVAAVGALEIHAEIANSLSPSFPLSSWSTAHLTHSTVAELVAARGLQPSLLSSMSRRTVLQMPTPTMVTSTQMVRARRARHQSHEARAL